MALDPTDYDEPMDISDEHIAGMVERNFSMIFNKTKPKVKTELGEKLWEHAMTAAKNLTAEMLNAAFEAKQEAIAYFEMMEDAKTDRQTAPKEEIELLENAGPK